MEKYESLGKVVDEKEDEAGEEGKDAHEFDDVPGVLPLLPVRDIVIFPYMTLPLFVGREASIAAVDSALAGKRYIFLAAQKDATIEEPKTDEIYPVGTVAMIMRMLKLPDGRIKILIQGIVKGKILQYKQEGSHMMVETTMMPEQEVKEISLETEALMRSVKEKIEKILNLKSLPAEISMVMENINSPGILADLVASNLRLKIEEAQSVLEVIDPVERLTRVNTLLSRELQLAEMQTMIQDQAKEEMSKTQREYFLREQLKAIKHELGDIDGKTEEIEDLRQKIVASGIHDEGRKEAEKQLRRLELMHPDSAEAATVRTYLDWLVELPWSKGTKDNINLKTAKKILDDDHFDLDQVKERILEYLAVRKMKKDMRGPILCFVGPPGVGKTSLGKSIARAMRRKFVRISLGGIRDEAEIRGHRRTYVGALPGRIVQGIKQAGTNNPVFMLDEIDKLGMDFRGDPSAALLEVLDPEQNFMFSDHYLNLAYDLSKVMFITTANLVDPIPPALKDRMEVITIPGYTDIEKLEIARKYLVPRQIEENGIKGKDVQFTDGALLGMINQYTKEAGLRNLEREIANVCRKVARRIAEGEKAPFKIGANVIHRYLGPPKFIPESESEVDQVGVATGLAWTMAGGDLLFIEVSLVKGKGQIAITGHLGDIMKESAQAAVTYARSRASALGIKEDFPSTKDMHIHVPAGAIPKDGPSAGITIATALVSVLAGIPVRKDVAMTGEITLKGRVLPVGGLKEKSLAAQRAGMKIVVLPDQNSKDLNDLPPYIRKKLHFELVTNMDEVLKVALKRDPFRKGRKGPGKAKGPRAKQVARKKSG
ncbi:MAG: endopeptidase La [Deltaproteobacteria bacterium]|nr:endopeptidase La [Deltaproteobacteria bacterium]NIS77930.1 endopeptidase La [Deltaproteobacteria bacterium]